MLVVRDIVEVHEPANEVILEALFRDRTCSGFENLALVGLEMLDQDVPSHWLQPDGSDVS